MSDVVISLVEKNELNPLKDVAIQAYMDHYTHLWKDGGKSYIQSSFSIQAFEKYFETKTLKKLYKINVNNSLSGFLTIGLGYDENLDSSPFMMELERIYFIKESTGKGIGSRVIQFLHSIADQNDIHTIWLKAMKKSPAVPFYQKHGWKITGATHLDHPQVIASESQMYIMTKALPIE